MNKKIFLTSFIALGFACPAMAEHQTVSTFPADEYMLEDYTYQNQATYTNMGVYEGSVSATADYTDIVYNIAAGNYLAAGSEATNGTQCPAGSWCPGISNINYSANTNQGLNACPNDYSNSVAGSSANTQCYRTCETTDVAHSASVSGQMYYDGTSGDGVNACGAETCVSGWHKKNGVTASAIQTAVGTGPGESRAWINGSDTFTENGASYGQSFYGITSGDTNAFAVNYGDNGIIHGHAACSTTQGTANWDEPYSFSTESSITDATGQEGARYCWCHVDGYTPNGETLQSLSSSWVFDYDYGNATGCASQCANYCTDVMGSGSPNSLAFRATLLGAVASNPASCEANTITITWADVDPTTAGQNNEGTATYGGDINTPVKAATKPGKTFVGWKFVKPAN